MRDGGSLGQGKQMDCNDLTWFSLALRGLTCFSLLHHFYFVHCVEILPDWEWQKKTSLLHTSQRSRCIAFINRKPHCDIHLLLFLALLNFVPHLCLPETQLPTMRHPKVLFLYPSLVSNASVPCLLMTTRNCTVLINARTAVTSFTLVCIIVRER